MPDDRPLPLLRGVMDVTAASEPGAEHRNLAAASEKLDALAIAWRRRAEEVEREDPAAARPLWTLVLTLRAARDGVERDGWTPGVAAMTKCALDMAAAAVRAWTGAPPPEGYDG